MTKVWTIVKINVLSLAALPLLLLAVAARLLAKAIEKLVFIIGAVVVFLIVVLMSFVMRHPFKLLGEAGTMAIAFFAGAALIALTVFLLSLAKNAVQKAAGFLAAGLNRIYEFLYGRYSALYQRCRRGFDSGLPEIENIYAKSAACLFYSLLRAVNICVLFFVTNALKLMILACVIFAAGTLFVFNRRAKAVMGMSFFSFVGLFPIHDKIAGVILYAAYLGFVCVLLILMGIKWNEWGREMKMATGDYDKYRDSFSRVRGSIEDNAADVEKKRLKRCREYLAVLNDHLGELEAFQARTQAVIQQSDNQALRSMLGEYMAVAMELSKKMDSMPDRIPADKFEELIPQIRRMEELKKDIDRLSVKMASSAQDQGSGFFAGCDTAEKLEKRYRALCRTYHPDSEAGDEETFKKMQEEYEERKASLNSAKREKEDVQ